MSKKFWLMKSEPEVYSFSQLKKDGKTLWSGVRNYQARNYMQKEMQLGDQVLFYHSSTELTGIAGLAEVVSQAEPDPTQFDKKSEYYDEKASHEKPRWFCVHVGQAKELSRLVSLVELRKQKQLEKMLLLRPGQRLSIQPVTPEEFNFILKLAAKPPSKLALK